MNENRHRPQEQLSLSDFPMPNSTDIEFQIIADIVSDQSLMQSAETHLNEDMFSNESSRNAWRMLKQMYNSHKSIDLTTFYPQVSSEYAQRILEKMSGAAYTDYQFCGHLDSLVRASTIRKTYCTAIAMLQSCGKPMASIDELLSVPESYISDVRGVISNNQTTQTISQAISELGDAIDKEQRYRNEGKTTRICTGFPTLDKITYGGFSAGNLVILAARPSVGKTAVMLQMAKAATIAGSPATIFSIEMTNQALAQRILLSSGEIQPIHLFQNMDWEAFERIVGKYEKVPLFLNDTSKSIDEICSKIIISHKRGAADIVFIDYLGLINDGQGSKAPLYQRIGEITKRLKQTAKDCRIPIVLLCQLNRQSATDNRPPQLYDLRDSGNIEQDADIVLMLERPQTESSRLNMWVRKNRQGKAGMGIELCPNSTYTDFTDYGAFE